MESLEMMKIAGLTGGWGEFKVDKKQVNLKHFPDIEKINKAAHQSGMEKNSAKLKAIEFYNNLNKKKRKKRKKVYGKNKKNKKL